MALKNKDFAGIAIEEDELESISGGFGPGQSDVGISEVYCPYCREVIYRFSTDNDKEREFANQYFTAHLKAKHR